MAPSLIRALTLGLLAITLPLAARGLYGPAGAWVHVRWQPSVDAAERQRLEIEWQLVDGMEVSPSTWRYDLTAPSKDRLRAIVAHPVVADTHFIDRQRYTLAPETRRTARRHGWITARGAVAVGLVDRLGLLLAVLAGLCVLVRHPMRVARSLLSHIETGGAFAANVLYGLVMPSPQTEAARNSPDRSSAAPDVSRRAGAGIALVLAPGVCLIAFVAVVTRMLELDTDFPHHIRYAQQLAETGAIQPHLGYHAVVIVVQALTPADWVAAAGIVTLGGVAACAAVVAWWLRGALSTSVPALLVCAALVPVAVCVLQPILPFDPTRYDLELFGYFPPNQWVSPTTLFSKPFALLLLGLGPAVVWSTRGARAGRTRILTSASLVVTSVLVKPNFIMAFLPALGALAVLHWRRTDWRWFGLSFAIPAVAVLGWQYYVVYPLNPDGAGVILAPLQAIGVRSSTDLVTLGWRLIASVLFPLTAVACFPSVRADRRVQLGWATVFVGAAIGYLLAESQRPGAGNFLWSGQLAVFVLFAASTVAVLRDAATVGAGGRRLRRFALCGSVFLWHVASGIQHVYSKSFA